MTRLTAGTINYSSSQLHVHTVPVLVDEGGKACSRNGRHLLNDDVWDDSV